MTSLLQQPHKQLPVCIFKSKPGLGKNLMFETLLSSTILGDDYFTISEKLDLLSFLSVEIRFYLQNIGVFHLLHLLDL